MPGRGEDIGNDPRGARLPCRITRGRPAQQKSTADRKRSAGFFRKREKGSIGLIVDREPIPALTASIQALGMQHAIDVSGHWGGIMPASKGSGKGLRICAAQAALEGLAAREAKIIAAAKAGGGMAAIKAAMKG